MGGPPHTDLIDVYTIASNSWATIPPVSGSTPNIYGALGVTWEGAFYIYGGFRPGGAASKDLFLYHAENQTFSTLGTIQKATKGCSFLFNTEP